ncbi:hypothetical protein BANRA_01766 [Klebsiella pneumoniae]|nr:hypothetical protein BANRA_01766 [Klebsiella pneumoniae]
MLGNVFFLIDEVMEDLKYSYREFKNLSLNLALNKEEEIMNKDLKKKQTRYYCIYLNNALNCV